MDFRVEFISAVSSAGTADGLRVISRAALPAIGLVDLGSYRNEIELRAAFDDAWLTAEVVPTGGAMQCTCQGGGCDSVFFEAGAF